MQLKITDVRVWALIEQIYNVLSSSPHGVRPCLDLKKNNKIRNRKCNMD